MKKAKMLILHGTRLTGNEEPESDGFLNYKILEDIEIGKVRSESTRLEVPKIKSTDVFELRIADSGKDEIWIGNIDDLETLFPEQVSRSAGDKPQFEMPVAVSFEGTNRGLKEWIIKGVKLFRPEIDEKSFELFVKKQEKKFIAQPGLFHCSLPLQKQMVPVLKLRDLPVDDKPYLLLLHGTASSTEGSFGGLATDRPGAYKPVWQELRQIYGNRILAFEHYTLTKSPVRNCIDLLKSLPKGIKLHLISHSRGGLIGELLSRSHIVESENAFTEVDFTLFKKLNRAEDVKDLEKLNALFKEKEIKVENFVRVACPAAGTTLASGRIDLYLNIILNLVGQIPGLKGNPIYGYLKSLIVGFVKLRTNPRVLPGLEAMMPDSPFIRMVNNPLIAIDSNILVVAGNATADTFLKGVVKVISRLFYLSKNDFVVNTPAMYRGAKRHGKAFYFYDEKNNVSHFEYFQHEKSQRVIFKGLTEHLPDVNEFRPMTWDMSEEAYLAKEEDRGGVAKPVVFVVPGLMGSQLAVNYSETEKKKIWVDLVNLGKGGLADLQYGAENVEPVGLVASGYKDICEYLKQSHSVVSFAYDWRLPIEQAADKLQAALAEKLDATSEHDVPVRILAHGMGGLVARALMLRHPETWQELKARPNSRMIMLGTPCGGMMQTVRAILGEGRAINQLSLVDLRHSKEEVLKIVSRFPGLLQLLPHGDGNKYFKESFWAGLKDSIGGEWSVPAQSALDEASGIVKQFQNNPLRDDAVYYIAGKAEATPVAYEPTEPDAVTIQADDYQMAIRFMATPEGDGQVSWERGNPKDLPAEHILYMEQEHGRMTNTPAVFDALLELLSFGKTTKSSISKSPGITRGTVKRKDFPDDRPTQIPGKSVFLSGVLGYSPQYKTATTIKKVRVQMSHGDLSKARFPVVAGHFKGDGILHAEWALNHFMDDKLWVRYNLGVYPGEIDTNLIILDPGNNPPGAIVVGLGISGSLSPGSLAKTVMKAALEFSMRKRELALKSSMNKKEAIPQMSFLLIGSGYGSLPMRLALRSMLLGVSRANEQITALKERIGALQCIRDIEFIEIYETKALNALRILRELIDDDGSFENFELHKNRLERRGGGRRRVVLDEDADWWKRIKVEYMDVRKRTDNKLAQQEVNLRFTSLTDRARAEENTISSQKSLLDKFLRQAVVKAGWNIGLAKTLFELMLPNDFKVYATDNRNILWILDEGTAAYPWELLQDTENGDKMPIAVRAGMVRQLVTTELRRDVKASLHSTALVVGDPDNNNTLSELEGAQEEARIVGELLNVAGFDMKGPLIRRKSMDILQALFEQPFRVIHLAGHGIYEEQDGYVRAGMVLDDNTLITPAIIRQMSSIPDLVFVNCCHLGKIKDNAGPESREELWADRHKLAANLGMQLIREGVKAVVVAGWAINDAAAKTFARTFYQEMLDGKSFGMAVRQAREKTYYNHTTSNTWGAYQCYGDPFFRIRKPRGGEKFHINNQSDRVEIIVALDNLIVKSETYKSKERHWLEEELKNIENCISADLREDAAIIERLADAFRSLNNLPKAIEYYDFLNSIEKANYSFSALEQAENLRSKYAIKLYKENKQENKARAIKLIERSIERLESFICITETIERYNLLASSAKNMAWISDTKAARFRFLKKAIENYENANRLFSIKNNGQYYFYPLLNWTNLMAILYFTDHGKALAIKSDLKDKYLTVINEEVDRAYGGKQGYGSKEVSIATLFDSCSLGNIDRRSDVLDFWERVKEGDRLLSELLWEFALERHVGKEVLSGWQAKIVRHYQKASKVSGSFGDMATVTGEIGFLLDMIPKNKEQLKPLRNTLTAIIRLVSE